DLSSLFDDALIDAAIDHSRPLEIPALEGTKYFAFTDASAGRHDAFTCAIAHKKDDLIVVDVLRGHHPPFDPDTVAQEFVKLAKNYGCRSITGDNYAGDWVAQAFIKAGLEYEQAKLAKAAIYLECLPLFSRGVVRLPDHAKMIREMRLLE